MELNDPRFHVLEDHFYLHSLVRKRAETKYKPVLKRYIFEDQIRSGLAHRRPYGGYILTTDILRVLGIERSGPLRLLFHLKVLVIDFLTMGANRVLENVPAVDGQLTYEKTHQRWETPSFNRLQGKAIH